MPLAIRTAVAASADQTALHAIALLLAENGIALEATAGNGLVALECLNIHRPDLLIADLSLPVMDGAALIERALGTYCLPVRPRAMLIHYPEYTAPDPAKILSLGAYLIEKPLDRADFSRAIAYLAHALPVFPENEAQYADKLLDDLGFSDHTGRHLLKNAALIAAHNEFLRTGTGAKLIPLAAGMCAVSPAQAERAMRYAIAQAWRSDKFENQYRIFSDTVDAGRGQPTLSEMISRLADILRLEG